MHKVGVSDFVILSGLVLILLAWPEATKSGIIFYEPDDADDFDDEDPDADLEI
jgi:hypothetical protein